MLSRRVLVAVCLVVLVAGGAAAAEPVKPKDGPLGMKFVLVPKGTFYLGWNGEKGSARPAKIKEDFEIAVYTVTQGQWQEVIDVNPSHFSRMGEGKDKVKEIKDEELKQFPVERVSWNDAQEFLKKLNEQEKGKGYLYRLPTAAEWEYACRGAATTEKDCSYHFYFDKPTNTLSPKQANFNGDYEGGKGAKGLFLGRTTKVGSYAPNKLGLYDMHGNVGQWVTTDSRVTAIARGGDWTSADYGCHAWSRISKPRASRDWTIGFRLVRDPVR